MRTAALILPKQAKGLNQVLFQTQKQWVRRQVFWLNISTESVLSIHLGEDACLLIVYEEDLENAKAQKRIATYLRQQGVTVVFWCKNEASNFCSQYGFEWMTQKKYFSFYLPLLLKKMLKRGGGEFNGEKSYPRLCIVAEEIEESLMPLLVSVSSYCHAIDLVTSKSIAGEMLAMKLMTQTGTSTRVVEKIQGCMDVVLNVSEEIELHVSGRAVTGLQVTVPSYDRLLAVEGVDSVALACWIQNVDEMTEMNTLPKIKGIAMGKELKYEEKLVKSI